MTRSSTADAPAWRRNDSIAVVENSGRAVVLELSAVSSRPLVLEATALMIWNQIDGVATAEDIVARLSAGLDVAPGRIREEVAAFLLLLSDEHLIVASRIPHLQGAGT